MEKSNKFKWMSIVSQLFMMALVVVIGGGLGAAASITVDQTPESSAVTPPDNGKSEGDSATDDNAHHTMFPEQSVTTGEGANKEVYEPQYDKLLTKIRPVRTPIDQISRRAARTKNVKSMEFKYGTVDYLPVSTTLGTAYTAGTSTQDFEPVNLKPTKPSIFNRRDIIIVKGVPGYLPDGTTKSGEDLKLWVTDRTGNKSIDVIAINGPKNANFKSGVPSITQGVTLVRIAKACAELDSQAPGYAIFPYTDEQYNQKFMAQVEQSTIDQLTAKRFDITLSDQEEAVLADMRLGMEGAYLFGTKSKFLDPDSQRYVWTTKGIWNMVTAETDYTDDTYWTIANIINLAKTVFTGPGAGKSDTRLVVCGSELLASLEKAFVGNYTFIHSVKKWDLTFTEVQTNFGSFWFILDEVFDLHDMSGDGLILDVDYLEKYNFEPFHANTLDLDGQGVRDSKARVLREISSMVLKSPNNHMKIVKKA